MKNKISRILAIILLALPLTVAAQVGDHRNDFAIGVNGGYVLSNVGFTPSVRQSMYGGFTGGLSMRYVCEKYFNTICSIYGEVNYASVGWKEKILTGTDQPVINSNGLAEEYSRTVNYVQVPVFAHLAWGREQKGFNFFFQAGPQLGLYLGESTSKNYDTPNLATDGTGRSNPIIAQESMPVEKKLDYGIAAGLGMEYSNRHVGHFLFEARYYYGLGNIYGSSKKDYFGKSNYSNIVVKATYLFDIVKTK